MPLLPCAVDVAASCWCTCSFAHRWHCWHSTIFFHQTCVGHMILRNIKKLCVRLPYASIIVLTYIVHQRSLKRKEGYTEKPYKSDFKFQLPLSLEKIPCMHGYRFQIRLTNHWGVSMQSHLSHGLPQESRTRKSWACGRNIQVLWFFSVSQAPTTPPFQVATTSLLTLLGRSSLQFTFCTLSFLGHANYIASMIIGY